MGVPYGTHETGIEPMRERHTTGHSFVHRFEAVSVCSVAPLDFVSFVSFVVVRRGELH